MHRRNYVKGLGALATGTATALAGCSGGLGGGGSPGEVVENELEGDVSVTDQSLENAEYLGTDVVVSYLTLSNSTSEPITVEIETVYYDGDTRFGTDDRDSGSYEVPAEGSVEADEGIPGRKDDVTNYEISIFEAQR